MMSCRNSKALILSLLLLAFWPANSFSQQPQTKRPLTENEDPLLIGKRNINRQRINFYSAEKEIALGRQLAAEIEQQSRLVDDTSVNDYLAKLGRNLADHSDATVPMTIKVIDSEKMSAVALPGGFLYVNLGLMRAYLESERTDRAISGARETDHQHGRIRSCEGAAATGASKESTPKEVMGNGNPKLYLKWQEKNERERSVS